MAATSASTTSTSTLGRSEDRLRLAQQRLTAAIEDLVTGEDWKRTLDVLANFHRYSFANTLLLHAQHADRYAEGTVPTPEPSLVAGFRQWKSLGRSVCKGQRGYLILAPAPSTVRVAQLPDGTSRRLQSGEAAPAGATVETSRMLTGRYTTAHVWDVSQTDGEPIPEQPRVLLSGQAPDGLWDGLAAIAADRGFAVHDAPDAAALGGANGLTDYDALRVLVRADMPGLARAKTLAHEIAHVLLHDPVGGDADWQTGARQHRGRAEVEAESTAYLVLAAHGIASDDYTFPYVATWASGQGQNPVDVVRQTGARVQRATRDILTSLGLASPSTGPPASPVLNHTGRAATDAPLHSNNLGAPAAGDHRLSSI
jgi:antirestriction protein ArdC